ncbi:hypothetical protein LLH00_04820 [bacterium]|nr:hypothetical protein [bacterium]
MLQSVSIYLGGVLTLLLAVFHTRFHRVFGWAEDFGGISVANRRIVYTIHVALYLLLFMLGGLSLVYARELAAAEGLALGFDLLCAVFWAWRFVWQLAYFKPPAGRKRPPLALAMTVAFLLLTVCYALPVLCRFL